MPEEPPTEDPREESAEQTPEERQEAEEQEPAPTPQPIIESVTVTATRVETDMMKTPVAVSAFDQETLEQQGVQNVRDLARLVAEPAGESRRRSANWEGGACGPSTRGNRSGVRGALAQGGRLQPSLA